MNDDNLRTTAEHANAGAAADRLTVSLALRREVARELDRLEAMATVALPRTSRHLGWSALPSDSGLTEGQEDFVDYWSPQRVLDDCQAKRELIDWIAHQQSIDDRSAYGDFSLEDLLRRLVAGLRPVY